MNNNTSFYLREIVKNESGASEISISKLQEQAGFELPNDYIDVMKLFDGGEGEVGENGWLCLFPVSDLLPVNNDYVLLMKQIPDYFLFGKDAADTGFAFHKLRKTIHSFGLMSDFKTDPIEFCGNSFTDFIEYLYNL